MELLGATFSPSDTGGVIDELKKTYPPDRLLACATALELGIDVSLLEANLRLTPAERLQAHLRQLRLQESLQAANLSVEQRQAIELRRLREKLARYGLQTNIDS